MCDTRKFRLARVGNVDFELDPAQRAWVAEVREFLQQNVTGELRAEIVEHGLELPDGEVAAFRRKVGAKGWFGLNWPGEYGGLGLSAVHQHLLMREFDNWAVPGPDLTVTSVAPMIMRHGMPPKVLRPKCSSRRLRSRWCRLPQDGQRHVRVPRLS
jgi:alkylation response protein AidB-like acyl-CoA dehydrogenase